MSLLTELKRRNVIRVAIAYAVIAWFLMQAGSLLFSTLELGASANKFLLAMLLLGFVPVVLFSWAFELTPEGIKKEKDVERGDSVTNITAKKLDYITLAAAVGVLGLFAYQQVNPHVVQTVQQSNLSVVEENPSLVTTINDVVDASIAVLPFVDLSPNKDQSHFSDGIAEEILNVLVRIESLNVASRTSAFGFKGQEALGIPLIAEKLKVRHVLEGSVRKSGDNVRITAQLIDAKTDVHLWSETYDRELTTGNIFAVQDEIAGAIVKQLGLLIGDEENAKTPIKVTTESVDAYELYLKAQGLFHVRSRDNLPEVVELYEKAVAIDPEFAEAWAGLSATYLVVPGWNLGSQEEYYPKAKNAADRASELDDSLALPYAVRGGIVSDQGNMVSAIEQMDMAIQRDPLNIQSVYFRAANILDLGYLDIAEAGFRRCLELDSNYAICRRFLSFVLLYQGDDEKASELFEAGLLKGQSSYFHVFENYYGAIGDTRALSLLIYAYDPDVLWPREVLYRFHTDNAFSLETYNAELRVSTLGDAEDAPPYEDTTVETLADGYIAEFLWSPYQPILRRPELRDEYLRVRKMKIQEYGFDDYWRKHGFPPQCRALGDDDFECDVPIMKK